MIHTKYFTPSWTRAFHECSSLFANLKNNTQPGLLVHTLHQQTHLVQQPLVFVQLKEQPWNHGFFIYVSQFFAACFNVCTCIIYFCLLWHLSLRIFLVYFLLFYMCNLDVLHLAVCLNTTCVERGRALKLSSAFFCYADRADIVQLSLQTEPCHLFFCFYL